MKRILLLVILLYSALYLKAQTLSGRITDSATHLSIPGAVVYIPQLKLGATTDADGYYKIEVPKCSCDIEMQCLGYAPLVKHVTIAGTTTLNCMLAASASNMQDVVVTALGIRTTNIRSPMPITVVSHDMFMQQSSTNVVDAIAKEPGITAITTGPGVSKPEINGLGYNRVLTLLDGERQEDFQWGDEHGILIDPYAVYNAEIIRGPASLQYGANAMAGVVSFKSQPSPQPGTIQGSVLSEYQTNNGLTGNSVDLAGNNKGFEWDVRGSYEAAHCYWDPRDGYVWGTAFYQDNGRATVKWSREWGYSRLSFSTLHKQIEIPDGNRDSATRQFEYDVPLNAQYYPNGEYVPGTGQLYPTRANFLSYNPNISSYQLLNHNELWWQNSIKAGAGKIIADVGFSQSKRREIDTGNTPEENMNVNDVPYSFKYQLEGNAGLKLTTGINGVYEFMKNGTEPPAPYIGIYEIPNYHVFDAGGYGVVEKDFDKLTLSGGMRYDLRNITGQPMYLLHYFTPAQEEVPAGTPGAYTQFSAVNNTYSGYSGSIGATYQLPMHYYVKLNMAKSFRAPAINELTSNELNPGAFAYELGNIHLKPEEGYQIDVAIDKNGRDVNFEADGFYNYINNFIFSDRLGSKNGGDSILLKKPVYQYNADIAVIAGVAAYLNIHPAALKWIEMDNGFTYIYSYLPGQSDSERHVPWTPAPRFTSKIRVKLPDRQTSVLGGTYFEFGLAKYWPQSNIYNAFWTELPSYAYTLYNAGIGANFVNPRTRYTVCTLIINCTNLTNIAYVDHTSREQYFWTYNGANDPANFGRVPAIVTNQSQGIYNMGRNVGIKVIFSIGGHKVSDTELAGTR